MCFFSSLSSYILLSRLFFFFSFFFFNDTATTEIYTLSLHDALPILARLGGYEFGLLLDGCPLDRAEGIATSIRSEEHTSELQSLTNLVCRLLLEKKKKKKKIKDKPYQTKQSERKSKRECDKQHNIT